MIAVGFVNFETEWWYYSFGDQMWGKKKGKKAKYGAVSLSYNEMQFEKQHRYYWQDGITKMA